MPTAIDGARAPGFRFGDPRTAALCNALSHFRWVFAGFRNRDLRDMIEKLLARPYGMRQMA